MKSLPHFGSDLGGPIDNPQARRGLMDLKGTCEWLCASPRFVTEEVRRGRIRVVRLGRLLRFDPADLAAYAEARKSGGEWTIALQGSHERGTAL